MKFKSLVPLEEYDKVVKLRDVLRRESQGKNLLPGVVMKFFSAKRVIDSEGNDTKYYDVEFEIKVH